MEVIWNIGFGEWTPLSNGYHTEIFGRVGHCYRHKNDRLGLNGNPVCIYLYMYVDTV